MSSTTPTTPAEGDESLGHAPLPAAVVRTTLDQLTQAVYLYQPVFVGERITDLEIVYCNRAAAALPFTERIVPGALASEVFVDAEDAFAVAELAWAGAEPQRYDVVRSGLIDGAMRSIRYEISTGRAGDLLVQTSHDHTVDDRLERSQEQLCEVVESLTAAIVLLQPQFDDDLALTGARPVYANEAARTLERALRAAAVPPLQAPPLELLRSAWTSSEPLIRAIDNVTGSDPALPAIALELCLRRVGDLLVHVGHDHTDWRRAGLDMQRRREQYEMTLDVVGDSVGVFEPIVDGNGTAIDLRLVQGNLAMSAALPVGGRVSDVSVVEGDPLDWGLAALRHPGTMVRGMMTMATGTAGQHVIMRVSAVASSGQVTMVGADVTEMQQALGDVTRSDALLRTVLESLAESVRVFDHTGSVVYANQASRDLLGDPDAPDQRYRVSHPSGEPLAPPEWPLARGRRGERVDDLVVLVERPDQPEVDARVCRVAVRPIVSHGDEPEHDVVVSAHDITESTRHAERLAWLSGHSRLTGLLNRAGLTAEMTEQGLDGSRPTVVVWVGLSALSTIRPTFGTVVGDDAMQISAHRVTEIADRCGGIVAQPTDQEFVVVAPGRDLFAQALVEELLRALSEAVTVASVHLLLEPTLGVAVATDRSAAPDELLRRAQSASWSADVAGADRDRWRPDLGAEQMRRVELLGDVQRAIDDGEMTLFFQPKFRVATGEFVGAEALVRWRRPDGEWITPDQFIPALEVSGLARPFTLWAVQRALDDWKPVRARWPHASVAVNVPGPMLLDATFTFSVGLELERRARPGELVLEITERSVAADTAGIANAIDRLTAVGVGVSIDDFGTGESSLASLRDLRPSEIKIDRAFVVRGADGSDPVSRTVLQACVDIGHAAGATVCGEGVSEPAELALLREFGCDVVQGYLLGRPGPVEDLLAR